MKQPVRTGRTWIPREWRQAIRVSPWRRSAIIAVTGAWSHAEAVDVLAGHLPMIPAALLDDSTAPAAASAEPVSTADGTASDPDHDDFGDDLADAEAEDPEHAEDARSARRIAHRLSPRLSSIRNGRGTRELITVRAIHPARPAVYAWRRTAPGEAAYRLYPDGGCDLVGVFAQVQELARSGQPRPRLIAHRYT
jgi:hypothetical protein